MSQAFLRDDAEGEMPRRNYGLPAREDPDFDRAAARALLEAARAGARVVKPAAETFWGGYGGYFQDPDGHLWEVVWNPQLLPE